MLALGVVAAIIIPRADEVQTALRDVSFGRFALAIGLGILAMIFRTTAWQIAIDSAGGQVRAVEAHAASSASFVIGLISPYLGIATRIAVIRNRVPERSPTTSQQIAAETVLMVVETALVGALILCAAWTLQIPVPVAVLIFVGGLVAAGLLVLAARRWAPRRFGAGLAVARHPRAMAMLTAAVAAALTAQIVRVAVVLSSVGLNSSLIVVVAVFLASGVGAVLPIGTAASGAAAPLIAASAENGSVTDASAAGILLSGSLMAACLTYFAIAMLVAASSSRRSRSRALERG